MTMFKNFLKDEAGAVTIDWVALTAGILLLGIAVVYAIFNEGVDPLVTNISSNLAAAGSNVSTGAPPNINDGS
jgi:Flp pilus assembly pilin Flp